MLRRTELSRGTKPLQAKAPLVARTPLMRRVPLASRVVAIPGRRRQPAAAPGNFRAVLRERSGGWCEMQLPGCAGQGVDPAHRISVKAGGRRGVSAARHDVPSNALWACRTCHDWCHARPAEAGDLGLMLREYHNPLQEPVVRRGELVYLDNDGNVWPYGSEV